MGQGKKTLTPACCRGGKAEPGGTPAHLRVGGRLRPLRNTLLCPSAVWTFLDVTAGIKMRQMDTWTEDMKDRPLNM